MITLFKRKERPKREKKTKPPFKEAKKESKPPHQYFGSGGKKGKIFPPSGKDFQVIQRPIITERGTLLEKEEKYIFEVSLQANKHEIKKAIEKIYNTRVKKINVMKRKGKKKKLRGIEGKTSTSKRAVVTLKEGEKIEIISR